MNFKNGIYPHENHYNDIASYFNIIGNKIIAFDPLNPILLNAIYRFMVSPLTKMGIDFFWNDMKMDEVDVNSLWLINNSLFKNTDINYNSRKIILARN